MSGLIRFLATLFCVCFSLFCNNSYSQCGDQIIGYTSLGEHNGSSYYISDGLVRAADAKAIAEMQGGHLVVINSSQENLFLSNQIDGMVHIGLDDAQTEGNLQWANGDAISYTNYDFCAFCSDNDAENDYAIMHQWNGGWSFTNQWTQRRLIIEFSCDENMPEPEPCNDAISGFEFLGNYNNSNYFLSTTKSRPLAAQNQAEQNGGYLTSISDQAENDFLYQEISEMVWIGLNDENSEGQVNWLNGESVGYSNYDICTFCSDNNASNDFVIMHPWDGGWSWTSHWSERKFIMEVPCEEDNGDPILSLACPTNINVTPTEEGDVFVSWNLPNYSTTCTFGGLRLTSSQTGNSAFFEQGNSYVISYEARDNCLNVETCSFTINVGTYDDDGGNPGTMVPYTANDQVTPYTGLFRPGSNLGYNPPWTDEQLGSLAAGDPQEGILGAGAKTIRPALYDFLTATGLGYDFRLPTFQHYENLGLDDLTMIVGFPAEWHRDLTDYCGDGNNSAMFRNLYTDIWDDGTDGTPYNDDNFYAAYLYEVVTRYNDQVKFWEIWNEPGFDYAGVGWREPGDPAGNWWDRNPSPCENILRAPIQHYIRTLRISWEIIKTVAPEDYVAVAGVGYASFLDAVLRNTDNPIDGTVTDEYPYGGGAYFDVMGFHSYPDIDGSVREFDPNTGAQVYTRNSDVAAQGLVKRKTTWDNVLRSRGYGTIYPEKEWIMTEFNVPRKAFKADAMTGGTLLQVNYVTKAMVTAMKNDVRQMHIYNLGDATTENAATNEFDNLGLFKKLSGTVPGTEVYNSEAYAYKTTSDVLYGSTYDPVQTGQMNLPSTIDGGAFRYSNGNYVYVIWAKATIDQNEFASASYSFPAGFGLNQLYKRIWDHVITNQTVAVLPNNINLTSTPVFLSETVDFSPFSGRKEQVDVKYLNVNEIYPNPAIDEIFFMIQSKTAGNHSIEIFDLQGNLMEQSTQYFDSGLSKKRFNISAYPAGMYFMIIKDSELGIAKTKFAKIRD